MALKQTIEAYELLDSAYVDGPALVEVFKGRGVDDVSSWRLHGEKGFADIISINFPGKHGKTSGGNAPTLNIAGSLGGIGGRPEITGIVSDADGAVVAIASGLKIADMRMKGDFLEGDVIIRTNICPNAPTLPHDPLPFMANWIDYGELANQIMVENADGILKPETAKGIRILNQKGFAISCTVKEGWMLRVSPDALDIMERVTGRRAAVVPTTMQDVTPFANDIYHLCGLVEVPHGIKAPTIGVAITAEVAVPGAAPFVSSVSDMEEAVRFCVSVAIDFGKGQFKFFDEDEFNKIISLYGPMDYLQTIGKQKM